MKVLFLDCGMGAAGDMLAGALLGLLGDEERAAFVAELNGMGLDGVDIGCERGESHGTEGWRFRVRVRGREEDDWLAEAGHGGHHHAEHGHGHGHHEHRSLGEVLGIIGGLKVGEGVKRSAGEVYRLLAEAEGEVHGRPPGEVHFHEVGMLDAIADITAVCALMARTGAGRMVATPVNVGSGTVRCAHGVLPVPAPATAALLRGIPWHGSEVAGELCTPTGAAILRYFVREFGPMPAMREERVGVGVGTRDVGRASTVRAVLGDAGGQAAAWQNGNREGM